MIVSFRVTTSPCLAVEDLVLEDERLAALRDPVREERDRELGEVQLVSSPRRSEGLTRVRRFKDGEGRLVHRVSHPNRKSGGNRVVVLLEVYKAEVMARKPLVTQGLRGGNHPPNRGKNRETIPRTAVLGKRI